MEQLDHDHISHDQSPDDESGIKQGQGIDQTSGQRAAGGENLRLNDHATARDKSLS